MPSPASPTKPVQETDQKPNNMQDNAFYQILQEQNTLLKKLIRLEEQKKKKRHLGGIFRTLKWVVALGSVSWFVLQVKLFFEGLFSSITPDFSSLSENLPSYNAEKDVFFEKARLFMENVSF